VVVGTNVESDARILAMGISYTSIELRRQYQPCCALLNLIHLPMLVLMTGNIAAVGKTGHGLVLASMLVEYKMAINIIIVVKKEI
jgi:hypothetical protein